MILSRKGLATPLAPNPDQVDPKTGEIIEDKTKKIKRANKKVH